MKESMYDMSMADLRNELRIYIAAPFFNVSQIQLVRDIEAACQRARVPYYSPSLSQQPGQRLTPENAKAVFQRNIDAMEWANVIVAVMDWKMPEGADVRVVNMNKVHDEQADAWPKGQERPKCAPLISPSLNIPDAGTVWEVGYCYGRIRAGSMACVLYSERFASAKQNLMLACTCNSRVSSIEALRNVLMSGSEAFKMSEPIPEALI